MPQCINSLSLHIWSRLYYLLLKSWYFSERKAMFSVKSRLTRRPSSAAILTPRNTLLHVICSSMTSTHIACIHSVTATDFYPAEYILMCLALSYPSLHLTGSCSVPLQSFEAWTWSHSTFCGLPVLFLYWCSVNSPFLCPSSVWLLPQFNAGPSVPHSATRNTSGFVTWMSATDCH